MPKIKELVMNELNTNPEEDEEKKVWRVLNHVIDVAVSAESQENRRAQVIDILESMERGIFESLSEAEKKVVDDGVALMMEHIRDNDPAKDPTMN